MRDSKLVNSAPFVFRSGQTTSSNLVFTFAKLSPRLHVCPTKVEAPVFVSTLISQIKAAGRVNEVSIRKADQRLMTHICLIVFFGGGPPTLKQTLELQCKHAAAPLIRRPQRFPLGAAAAAAPGELNRRKTSVQAGC